MKKFKRIFKRKTKKLLKHIPLSEIIVLKKWIINVCEINYKILERRKEVKENYKLQKESNVYDLEKELAKRGEVFFVDFGYGIGSEYRYQHYCVVIKTIGNMAIVVPLTSKINNNPFSTNLGSIKKMPLRENKEEDSYALVNQIRSISRSRLKRPMFKNKKTYPKLTEEQLNKIDLLIDNLKK